MADSRRNSDGGETEGPIVLTNVFDFKALIELLYFGDITSLS